MSCSFLLCKKVDFCKVLLGHQATESLCEAFIQGICSVCFSLHLSTSLDDMPFHLSFCCFRIPSGSQALWRLWTPQNLTVSLHPCWKARSSWFKCIRYAIFGKSSVNSMHVNPFQHLVLQKLPYSMLEGVQLSFDRSILTKR